MAVILFVLVPAALRVVFARSYADVPGALFYHALVFVLPFAIFSLVPMMLRPVARWVLVSTAAAYFLMTYVLMGYWGYTGGQFDVFYVLDSWSDALPTVRDVVGIRGMFLMSGALILGCIVFFHIWARILQPVMVLNRNIGRLMVLAALVINFTVVSPSHGYLSAQVGSVLTVTEARKVITTQFPDNSIFKTDSNESVFILQLESGNGMAIEGKPVIDGKRYDGVYVPSMRRVAEDGLYLPLFWGNSMQTNRGQEAILCGIVNNMGDAYSYRLGDIKTKCLPEILKENGYKTVFLSSYYEDQFANLGEFVDTIGFEDSHHGDIMVPGEDTKYPWGYDDCSFVGRSFDYLKSTYAPDEKKFVYVEFTNNHMPFTPREEYAFTHPFLSPKNYIEKYLDSAAEQDHCVGEFYKAFQEYTGGNAHLVILPDHSWPVGTHENTYNERYAYNDNILTNFAYIPPVSRREEFRIGEIVDRIFNQGDIIPTIFELLNGTPYPQSFAFALKKDVQNVMVSPEPVLSNAEGNHDTTYYEDCHVFTQPYGGGMLAILKGNDKYIYEVQEQRISHYDLATDFYEEHPEVVGTDVSYDEFLEEYMCGRYRTGSGDRVMLWEGAVHLGNQTADRKWVDWDPVWIRSVGQEPVQEFSFPFSLNPGAQILQVELTAADMEAGHPILINGQRVGWTCSTGEKHWTCSVTLTEPFTILKSENTLTVTFGEEGSGDDFVLTGVSVVVE